MRVIYSTLLVLFLATNAFSQAQMSSGDIKGTVKDATGAVLPGCTVTVANLDTGLSRNAVTDGLGGFQFFLLPPGNYELKVELPGFAIYTRRQMQLTVGQTIVVDPELTPASVQQEIVVTEEVPLIETQKTQQSDTITVERIQGLPINGRNFLDFTLLTPGVTDSRANVTFTLPQTPTSGLSFAGQSGRSNNVTIDGVDNNDNSVSAVRSTISQEAVQEFQINRSNYSAEFGRASGGLINIVSKSGTNRYAGNVFVFVRDQAFDARNPFAFGPRGSKIDPPFSRVQAGFTSGGAIRKDRSFYFLSYEALRQRESNFVTFLENERFFQPTPSQRALLGALSTAPIRSLNAVAGALGTVLTTSEQVFPGTIKLLRDSSGVFPFRNNNNTASFRIDHAFSSSNTSFGRLTFTDIDTVGGAFGGLKGASRGTNFQIQDYSAVFGDTHIFSPRRVNEFRFQFASRDFNALPADASGPEININGVAFLGRDFFLPSTRNEKRYQWVDNFTLVSGKHEIKFGGDIHYIPLDTVTEVFFGGRFIFGEAVPLGAIIDNLTGTGNAAGIAAALATMGRADLIPAISAPISSLQAFNFGLPLAYQQGFGNPREELTNKILAGYLQDNFKISPKFTMNYGVRYDMEFQPTPIRRDKNNVSPRFGFSFTPDAKTVIRGGYGIYYAPVFEAIAFVGRVLDGTKISQVFIPLTGLPALGVRATSAQIWGFLRQQNIISNRVITTDDIARFGVRPGVTPPVLLKAAPDLVNPYSQQGSFGIDREFETDLSVSVNYLVNRGLKILRSRNVNLRQIGTNEFGPTFGPINPRILQDNQAESSASSIYHGMALGVTKRFSNHYMFRVAYTLSKAIDDSTDFITDLQPANHLDLRAERSLSSFDQRHRLVVSALLETPFERGQGIGKAFADLTISPIFTASGGHPFNLLLGLDANGDTQTNTDRPRFAGRNTGIGPDFYNFDLRVAKAFRVGESNHRVDAIFEAFNLFNRVNFSGVNNIVGVTRLQSHHVKGDRTKGPTDPLGFTSAFDPRQIQLAVKWSF